MDDAEGAGQPDDAAANDMDFIAIWPQEPMPMYESRVLHAADVLFARPGKAGTTRASH